MTDYEIIKALECCGYGIKEKCKECPLINHGEACMYKLKREAHNLIIRKKAEIEEFRSQKIVLPARACGKTALIKKSINDIRAEAIREFAEELMFNLDGEISAYSSAGHGLNVYSWLTNYLTSKGAIKYD